MNDLINRQAAIDIVLSACKDVAATECAVRELEELPQEPEIIYCKDCCKHNKRIGDYEKLPVGGKWIWKEDACPLIEFRGKAQGHEFDYQFCVYGKRRADAQ